MSTRQRRSNTNNGFDPAPVRPSHTTTDKGVRFNVQTVDTLGELLPVITASETVSSIENEAAIFYRLHKRKSSKKQRIEQGLSTTKFKLEAHSISPHQLVRNPAKSLAHIALLAFAEHYPLSLRPDDIWLAIACGAAKHINKNAKNLRSRFVSFEVKKKLEVEIDDAVMGHVPKHVWEDRVFSKFSEQIRGHIGENTHDLITGRFSTTTKTDKAASEITLLSAVQKYFSFNMFTLCGIPFVELHGSLEDWMQVRERTEKLKELLVHGFAERWMSVLLPVLDQFIEAYKGNVNHEFWQRMVKKVESGMSGKSDWLSGWIINLYPYLSNGELNQYMQPWEEMTTYDGPEPKEIPSVISSVPVNWNYYRKDFSLHYHAGILGIIQDRETRSLQPHVGWYVTHDPVDIQKKSNQDSSKRNLTFRPVI